MSTTPPRQAAPSRVAEARIPDEPVRPALVEITDATVLLGGRTVWSGVSATVGAGEFAHRPIGQLSGGEQQRLLIAQALARRPRLLMLDEPLDSLDLPNQAGVAALISQICRTEGVAVMIVAHDVNPILSYLDRV